MRPSILKMLFLLAAIVPATAQAQFAAHPAASPGVSVKTGHPAPLGFDEPGAKDSAGVENGPEMEVPLSINAKRQFMQTMGGPDVIRPTYANCDTRHLTIGGANSATVTGDIVLNNSDTTRECPDIGKDLNVSKDLVDLLQK